MAGIPSADEIEAAKAALQANLPPQAKKQEEEGSGASEIVDGVLDLASNVTIEGVGAVVGAVADGVGTVVSATGEVVVSVIGGIFEGLG
ncbi:MAG: hypothetical protein GY873_01465 [Bosea sp.]|uniref:hypothetical protein n=1 Tax=Bosea sp. (in: a-proteobacteria) TaxID=1871050 RepID=UPI0023979F26|nr:hypothetical protein [Bosea sp. (in: a-proteobacteria)]MCP4732838.1 hypothetical protein [Bosea sp. (in: a-proteobacteria)]